MNALLTFQNLDRFWGGSKIGKSSEKRRRQDEHKKKTQTIHDAGSVSDFELEPFCGEAIALVTGPLLFVQK